MRAASCSCSSSVKGRQQYQVPPLPQEHLPPPLPQEHLRPPLPQEGLRLCPRPAVLPGSDRSLKAKSLMGHGIGCSSVCAW